MPTSKISENKCKLTIVDELNRFGWAFPYKGTSTATPIIIYHELFANFGTPGTIHSDRELGCLPTTMRKYLNDMGINRSTTTTNHPRGNGQCERLNGNIWRTMRLLLHSHKLDISNWKEILPTAIHSIRLLFNTSINCTPHEKIFTNHRRPSLKGNKILSSWLLNPVTVLQKNFDRSGKNDSLVGLSGK